MGASQSILVPLAPFSFAAQSRGATLDAPARAAGTTSTSCSIAEWGENRKQVVTNSPHSLLLRQQSHTQPLTQDKLLRHRLVLGKIHCIWCCSLPFSFYLVFLCFLSAPKAIQDSTGTAAHCVFAVQRAVGVGDPARMCFGAPACTSPCSCSCRGWSAKDEELGHGGFSMKSVIWILCFCWKRLRETNSKDQKAVHKMRILLFSSHVSPSLTVFYLNWYNHPLEYFPHFSGLWSSVFIGWACLPGRFSSNSPGASN